MAATTNLTAAPPPVVKRHNRVPIYIGSVVVILLVVTYLIVFNSHDKPMLRSSREQFSTNTKSLYEPEPVVKPVAPPPVASTVTEAAPSSTPPPTAAAAQEDAWAKAVREHKLQLLKQQWAHAEKASDAAFERSQGLTAKRHEEKLAALRAGARVAINGSTSNVSQGQAGTPRQSAARGAAPIGGGGNSQALSGQQQSQQLPQQPLQQAGQIATAYLIPPVSPFMLKQGTHIPVVLDQWLNSDAQGAWVARVTADVYDSIRSQHVLIPAGSTLFGFSEVDAPTNAQPVLMLSAQTLHLPDGSSLNLNRTFGQNGMGVQGLSDSINRHLWQRYGSAAFLSLITAGVRMASFQGGGSQGYYLSPADAAAAGTGDVMGKAVGTELQRTMNIKPTVTVEIGYPFNLTLTQDYGFQAPWQAQQEE